MSVDKTIDVQAAVDEVPMAVSPPDALHELTEVPPPPAHAPPPAPEAVPAPPAELPPPPGLSSSSGLPEPIDVEKVFPEEMELLDAVSQELTNLANAFPTSQFMTKDEVFEFEYFTTLLPPGLFSESGVMLPPGLFSDQDENDLQMSKLEDNESSNDSTRAWSKSSNTDEGSHLDGSASPPESLVSDDEEDECNDEVPELPDLSTKGSSSRKLRLVNGRLENLSAKVTAAATPTRSSTRIVFGEQGAALAAQAALMANSGASPWVLPHGAQSTYYSSCYGYMPCAYGSEYQYVAW